MRNDAYQATFRSAASDVRAIQRDQQPADLVGTVAFLAGPGALHDRPDARGRRRQRVPLTRIPARSQFTIVKDEEWRRRIVAGGPACLSHAAILQLGGTIMEMSAGEMARRQVTLSDDDSPGRLRDFEYEAVKAGLGSLFEERQRLKASA